MGSHLFRHLRTCGLTKVSMMNRDLKLCTASARKPNVKSKTSCAGLSGTQSVAMRQNKWWSPQISLNYLGMSQIKAARTWLCGFCNFSFPADASPPCGDIFLFHNLSSFDGRQ